MSGPAFFQTQMGRTVLEGLLPRAVHALEQIATELKLRGDAAQPQRTVSALDRIATAMEERAAAEAAGEDAPGTDPLPVTTPAGGPEPLSPESKPARENDNEQEILVYTNNRFLCETCAKEEGVDLSLDEVQVWELYSSGWTGPVICAVCTLSLPVFVDAEEVK